MHAGGGEREQGKIEVTELTRAGKLYQDDFRIFLVQVKSDTVAGDEMLVDPISHLERNAAEMGLKKAPDTRAMVLRANAEVSANPKHRSEVWVITPGSTNAICIQYKYERDMVNPEGAA